MSENEECNDPNDTETGPNFRLMALRVPTHYCRRFRRPVNAGWNGATVSILTGKRRKKHWASPAYRLPPRSLALKSHSFCRHSKAVETIGSPAGSNTVVLNYFRCAPPTKWIEWGKSWEGCHDSAAVNSGRLFSEIVRTSYFLLVPLAVIRREEETFSTKSQESAPGQTDSTRWAGRATPN